MKRVCFFGIWFLFFFVSCSEKIPENFLLLEQEVEVFPDYTAIVIPPNIAPLHFNILGEGEDFRTLAYSRTGEKLLASGREVRWKPEDWRKLLESNAGDTLYLDIYRTEGKQWYKYPSIKNPIAQEEIDAYFSYRLIEPSYTVYEYMTINQRNLTSFEEKVIYSNSSLSRNEDGHCINCHAYQNYNKTGNMQFHIRQYKGGTVIATSDGIRKVNLKTDYTISAGVYPAWHPIEDLIAYSVNNTEQHFHNQNKEKVEVMDSRSDLILYDIKKNEVRNIVNSSDELETFPSWSPDGKYLYYVSAKYPDGVDPEGKLEDHFMEFHYDIYRKAFDMETYTFSVTDTVFKASELGRSATFPRISPDGKFLLFTLGDYGNFHIWHKSSDLYLLDLDLGIVSPLTEVNTPEAESYHSWSSNGSWIIFSSRRDDGSFTRPYISYFKDGKAQKPFIVPQKDPDFYMRLFKSFNIPEFMIEPVTFSKREWVNAIDKDAIDAIYLNSDKAVKNPVEGKAGFYD